MTFLYTGAYTQPPLGRARGIDVYRYDPDAGEINLVQTATGVENPSFLATSADERFLYAVCESEGGAVAAFARDTATGELTELNRQSSVGDGPCYVSVDPSGRFALVANYGSGSIAALPIETDGSLGEAASTVQHEGSGPNADRQDGPHAHMILPTPDGRWVLAVDLGTDEVITYSLDLASGQLERRGALAVTPGAGPRHLAFSPDAGSAYVITELANTMVTCDYDAATGTLTARQELSTLPEGYAEETYCAHVVATADGRSVYGSNRGHDSIVTFTVDPASGDLSVAGWAPTEGSFPRHFALDPPGSRLLVANQKSDTVTVLRRDAGTGRLSGGTVIRDVPSAVCLLFV